MAYILFTSEQKLTGEGKMRNEANLKDLSLSTAEVSAKTKFFWCKQIGME